ncbi:hypothetical protein N5U20_06655 [Aliarcobacter butzleri]|uniref:hypothetical protein n=1 Tax=Aliarcobacter butzleri TaxID=28197 RepID=UPI0021B4559A|nr:hypothetical protein [Aliarcobacter butzleri]MCT7563994.1 hypothetical protein [Aliarcobacter butzleri]MCT7612892.1 hypothetical protein [Aliarcobacter butzleri]MCT7641528.1 hypothetical protein [Aliarcobacter butzleri]
MNVKTKDTHDVKDIDNVCVVINELRKNQFHTGFFFKNSDNDVKFLHLGWFEDLRYEDPDDNYKWLDIPLDEFNQLHFQLFLENIYKQNKNQIPYGISIDGINIGLDGKLLKEEEHLGLTCATFVMRALHSQGYIIIDLDNWQMNLEDKEWQTLIINLLEGHSLASKEFIEHQKTYIGNVARYKPSEVVVAANSENHPLSQEDIIKLSKELINDYF